MTTINLRDVYPFYNTDLLVEVPDEVADALVEAKREEENARRRMYRHKAQYSLDRGDGIEHNALFLSPSPAELFEEKLEIEALYAALSTLPPKQGRRVYAHYILGMSNAGIARAEGITERNVRESINRALRSMKTFLKKP